MNLNILITISCFAVIVTLQNKVVTLDSITKKEI